MAMKYQKEFHKKGRVLVGGGPRDRQAAVQRGMAGPAYSPDSDYIIQELRKEILELKSKTASTGKGDFTGEQVDEEVRKAVAEALKESEGYFKNKVKELEGNNKKFLENMERLNKDKDQLDQKLRAKRERLNKTQYEFEEIKIKLKEAEGRLKLADEKIEAKDEIIEVLKKENEGGGTDTTELQKIIEAQNKKIEDLTMAVVAGGDVVIEDDPDRPQIEDVFVDPLEDGSSEGLVSHIEVEDVSPEKKEDMKEKVSKLKEIMGGLK